MHVPIRAVEVCQDALVENPTGRTAYFMGFTAALQRAEKVEMKLFWDRLLGKPLARSFVRGSPRIGEWRDQKVVEPR